MSTSPVDDLPEWGFVVGRFVERVLDTAADLDDKPEARAASTTVTFIPVETLTRSVEYQSFVTDLMVTSVLNDRGELTTPIISGRDILPGLPGIRLPVGTYAVNFQSPDGVEEFDIEIFPTHTPESPLVLSRNYTPGVAL